MAEPFRVPLRVQLRRTAGWRKPAGAVVVSRPSRWGNPFAVADFDDDLPVAVRRGLAVAEFRSLLAADTGERFPSVASIIDSLAGRDLACWCPIETDGVRSPCHADVLLEVANPGVEFAWAERRGTAG